MNRKKYSLYTASEFWQIAKLKWARKLAGSVPIGLQSTHDNLSFYEAHGIPVSKDGEDIRLTFGINQRGLQFALKKNASDSLVFNQIVLNQEYQVIVELFRKHQLPLNTMIDAGANIGLTSIYFSAHFPNAKIIALEPFPDTFNRMCKNFDINGLKQILPLKKGLWGRTSFLAPNKSFRDGLDWAFQLVETAEKKSDSIEALSIPDLMQEHQLEKIDFLKIDIEGGEVSVFEKGLDLSWLKQVHVIAIEIHDEYHCREHIENTLVEFGFELSHSGELSVGLNKNLT